MTVLSIRQIQQGLRDKAFSATELAQQTLAKIEQRNPQLNAFTDVTRDRLLAEAASVDQLIASGSPLPSLAGVPYAVKNLFDIKGVTTLSGAELFAGQPAASQDAFAITQLQKAGGMLSGALNMDAYAYGFTTENSYYGATKNPHDLSRIAGGSSGGSAAAVAAGMVNFSLGTDTNGSIRVPSSLCGLVGLKPTFGRLSRGGSHPFVASLDHIGPLARSVEDVTAVYDVLQGYDGSDPFQTSRAIEPVYTTLDRGTPLRVAMLDGFFESWCDADAKEAVSRVAKALQATEKVSMPEAELARSAAFLLTAAEGEISTCPRCEPALNASSLILANSLLAGAMTPSAWYTQAQRFRAWFRDRTLPLFDHFDLLIAPATPCSATLIGQQTMHINGQEIPVKASMGILTQPISFLGLPVVSAPLIATSGLPIGVQLIAAPWREDICLPGRSPPGNSGYSTDEGKLNDAR